MKIGETKTRVANIQERQRGRVVRASDLKSGGPALITSCICFR